MEQKSIGEVLSAIERLKRELAEAQRVYEGQVESTCTICERSEYAFEALPSGWGWLYNEPALLCDKCIERWTERFGAPKVHREGELIDDSSFSKDSPYWGQANFEFV